MKVQKRATLEMTWPKCFDERTTLASEYNRIQPAESLNLHMKLATETAGTNRIAKDRMLTVTPRTANDDEIGRAHV